MRLRALAATGLALLAGACGHGAASADQPGSPRIAQLRAITDKCGLPPSAARLVGANDLHLQPPFDAKYASVDCLIKEVKSAGFPEKVGFVGNEAYQTKVK